MSARSRPAIVFSERLSDGIWMIYRTVCAEAARDREEIGLSHSPRVGWETSGARGVPACGPKSNSRGLRIGEAVRRNPRGNGGQSFFNAKTRCAMYLNAALAEPSLIFCWARDPVISPVTLLRCAYACRLLLRLLIHFAIQNCTEPLESSHLRYFGG